MPESDLDALLGSDESTSGASQPSQQTDGNQPPISEEEREFNSLKGSAQERFRSVIRKKNDLLAENERLKALAYQNTKLPPAPGPSPDVEQAVNQLDSAGIATKKYVDQVIAQRESQRYWESRLQRLSEAESGQDGRPKFDAYEYQDFIRTNPQYQSYDPADVYSIMYRDELLDWEFKQRSGTPQQTQTLKNTKTLGRDDIWDRQYIEDKLGSFASAAERIAWYESNLPKIEKVMNQES